VIRPTVVGGRRIEDDASDRVVMMSWWLLPRKVSVVDPSNFVGPTTRSPARLASPLPFLSLYLSLWERLFSFSRTHSSQRRLGSFPILNFQIYLELDDLICVLIGKLHLTLEKYIQREIVEDDCIIALVLLLATRCENYHVREEHVCARVHAPHFRALHPRCAIMRQI